MRCANCRHLEDGACAHPKSYIHFTPDGEGAKHCPTFRSRQETRDSRIFTTLPGPVWVICLLVIIVGSLAAAAWFIDPLGRYFVGNPLSLEAHIPSQVPVNQPFFITMRISNLLPVRSTRIYIEIEKEYLDAALSGMPYPQPKRIIKSDDKVLFEYGPLEPNAELPIQLPFEQTKLGSAMFVARIYSPSTHLFREIRSPISGAATIMPVQPPAQKGDIRLRRM